MSRSGIEALASLDDGMDPGGFRAYRGFFMPENPLHSHLEIDYGKGMSESTFQPTINLKTGLAEMLKGGVIMDVVNVDQAKIAEDAGAVAVMALERVPSDIRKEGGVSRMSDPRMIEEIMAAVSIPVMAKVRIGHFVEAQILEALGVDYIDESEVLTPADDHFHINKFKFKVPFVCGACNLGEALRRIGEGAALMRTKGEAGTGDVVEGVKHLRQIVSEIRRLGVMDEATLMTEAKNLGAPYELVLKVAREGRLPVPNFAAGGVATPADAALMMQLGAESVFVGSGIFKSESPADFAKAIVTAVAQFEDPAAVLNASRGLGAAMRGRSARALEEMDRLADRGW
jgi:pyridoxal 5'-phosphate synthase pdxS subunit